MVKHLFFNIYIQDLLDASPMIFLNDQIILYIS